MFLPKYEKGVFQILDGVQKNIGEETPLKLNYLLKTHEATQTLFLFQKFQNLCIYNLRLLYLKT